MWESLFRFIGQCNWPKVQVQDRPQKYAVFSTTAQFAAFRRRGTQNGKHGTALETVV
jgi:hypothetical protein